MDISSVHHEKLRHKYFQILSHLVLVKLSDVIALLCRGETVTGSAVVAGTAQGACNSGIIQLCSQQLSYWT